MKPKQISVSIPSPCHEDWNKMTTTMRGAFCTSCSKEVIDFSKMNDDELLYYLKDYKSNTCGRFTATQLNTKFTIEEPQKLHPFSLRKIAAVFMSFMLFLESCVDSSRGKQTAKDKQEIIDEDKDSQQPLGEVVLSYPNKLSGTSYFTPPLVLPEPKSEIMGDMAIIENFPEIVDSGTIKIIIAEQPQSPKADSSLEFFSLGQTITFISQEVIKDENGNVRTIQSEEKPKHKRRLKLFDFHRFFN